MTKDKQLAKLRLELEAAVDRLPLARQISDIVHGEGSPTAQLVFIGEAPGYHESLMRKPFIGRSGQFLRQALSNAGVGLENIYFTNVVKARPPDNRDPSRVEIDSFFPFLSREIKLIQPKIICTLGRISLSAFLPTQKISLVHGILQHVSWHQAKLTVCPLYHPAAAIRSSRVRRLFLDDLAYLAKNIDLI